MKINKFVMVTIVILTIINASGCSSKKEIKEIPYLRYVITTYSGGKEIEKFEVYSDMQGYYRKDSVTVYDTPSENVLLFHSTLDYKLEEVVRS